MASRALVWLPVIVFAVVAVVSERPMTGTGSAAAALTASGSGLVWRDPGRLVITPIARSATGALLIVGVPKFKLPSEFSPGLERLSRIAVALLVKEGEVVRKGGELAPKDGDVGLNDGERGLSSSSLRALIWVGALVTGEYLFSEVEVKMEGSEGSRSGEVWGEETSSSGSDVL